MSDFLMWLTDRDVYHGTFLFLAKQEDGDHQAAVFEAFRSNITSSENLNPYSQIFLL